MKKIKIVGVLVVLVAIIGVVWFSLRGSSTQQVSKLDATDTVGNFYEAWLKAVQQPTTAKPDRAALAKSGILSKALKERLASAQKDTKTSLDPVLCQTVVPEAISMRNVYANEREAQMLITSKDKGVTEQAVVSLKFLNGAWYINDIQCSLGEFAPDREFSFEKEGYLLKGSVPKPYNPKNWHLVFEDNGELGHIAPLFFNSESQCISLNGSKSVCKPEQFTEASKVSVHGQMMERGADVKRLEFVK